MVCTDTLAQASLAARPDLWVVLGEPLFGTLLTFPALWLYVVVHEATHALWAWVLGMQLLEVRAGRGPLLSRFRALGCEWLVRSLPGEGHVVCRLVSERWFRTRYVIVYLSAPLVCAVLALWCAHAA